jgi:hypothetical protein
MAKLFLTYTAFNQDYMGGQFRCFQGGTGSPQNVQTPQDAVSSVIGAAVVDSEVYSYMGADGYPRALVCNVTTSDGTSSGKYFVCKADLSGANVVWSLIAGDSIGITLGVGEYPFVPVAGNPSGIVQVGTNLHITDYDMDDGVTNIYTVAISALEAPPSSGRVVVAAVQISDSMLPGYTGSAPDPDVIIHSASLIALTDNSGSDPVTKLFALYTGAYEDGSHSPNDYVAGRVVRLSVSAGVLTPEASVAVGLNTQSLTPIPNGAGGIDILVPAIGGYQHAGFTNGSNSTLHRISNIFGTAGASGTMAASIVLKGDGNPPTSTTSGPTVTTTGNFDIKSVGASDSGIIWLLLVTNDENYKSWWRLFKTTAAKVLAIANKSLADAIRDGDLTPVDSGFGSSGYYWELLCESSSTDPGRLWFVMGTPVRISAMDNYDDKVLFDEGTLYARISNTAFPYAVNLNSADLIGEMIYQYALGNSIDTRLIKGQKPSEEGEGEGEGK